MHAGRRGHDSGMGSPTRAFILGGYDNSNYTQDTQFKSIASGGDMVFGGDLVYKGGYIAGCSNSIRGFGTGGYQHPGAAATLQLILTLLIYLQQEMQLTLET